MPIRTILLLLAAACLGSSARAQVHFVSNAAPLGGDGTSWGTAFRDLNDAFAVAVPGEQIWIAEGTYRPDEGVGFTHGDRNETFSLPTGVEIYGGFVGIESDLAGRLGQAQNTILSGDLNTDDTTRFANHTENSYHVVTASGVSAATRLDSVTIAGGNANDAVFGASGGALLIELGAALRVSNCIFRDSQALEDGGAVFHTTNSNAVFEDCEFRKNMAFRDGGALMCTTSSMPMFTRCTFDQNVASRWGGASRNAAAALPRFEDCDFTFNMAVDSAGALWNDNAGITIQDCRFEDNEASNLGGAMVSTGGPILRNSRFERNTGNRGGAIYILGIFSRPMFDGCTFANNTGSVEGGAIFNAGKPIFTQCLFDTNTTPNDGGAICTKGTGQEVEAYTCMFQYNDANRGGAVFNSGLGKALYDDCMFKSNSATEWGGAMYHGEAELTLRDTIFSQNNSQLKGGAVFAANLVDGGSIRRCSFLTNTVENVGGGLYITNSSSPIVEDCLFSNNFARIHGAGVYNTSSEGAGGDSSGLFERCRFTFNTSPEDGAAFFNATSVQGGTCSPVLIDCLFDRNVAAKDGAGFYNIAFGGTSAPQLINVSFTGNVCGKNGAAFHNTATAKVPNTFSQPHFQNCVFSGNVSNHRGGAFYNDNHSYQPGNSNAVFSGCVLSQNSAAADGGGIFNWHTRVGEADLTFRNTIMWGNSDVGGVDQTAQFFNYIGDPTIEHCCIEGWLGGGTGNVSVDPLFLDPTGVDGVLGTPDDNLRLASVSLLLDAGDNSGVLLDDFDFDSDGDFLEPIPIDGDRTARFFDSPIADTGVGSAPVVDLGAYEAGDCDSNGINDAEDVFLGASDCNGNHVPDICEIDQADGGLCVKGCASDCNANGIPDECEPDCNGNGTTDACDISGGTSQDTNRNGIPDECEG